MSSEPLVGGDIHIHSEEAIICWSLTCHQPPFEGGDGDRKKEETRKKEVKRKKGEGKHKARVLIFLAA